MNQEEKEFLSKFSVRVSNGIIYVSNSINRVYVGSATSRYCCGILDVGGVRLDCDKGIDELLTALSIVLQNLRDYGFKSYGLVSINDKEGGMLWKMATENDGWTMGSPTRNPNSGNTICMFETQIRQEG